MMKKMAATDDRAIDAVCGSQLDFSGKAGAPQVGETLPVRTSSQSASQTAHVQNSSVKSSDGQIELPKKLELRECCREAFGKITDYVNGELSGRFKMLFPTLKFLDLRLEFLGNSEQVNDLVVMLQLVRTTSLPTARMKRPLLLSIRSLVLLKRVVSKSFAWSVSLQKAAGVTVFVLFLLPIVQYLFHCAGMVVLVIVTPRVWFAGPYTED